MVIARHAPANETGLKMHYYYNLAIFNITQDIQIRGAGAPQLLALMPTNFISARVAIVGMQGSVLAALPNIQLLSFTRPSVNLMSPAN